MGALVVAASAAPALAVLAGPTIAERLQALDWGALGSSLSEFGYARTGPVLTPHECASLIALYADERRFRSRVEMARHRFGVGDYKYFARPLPALVQELRVHAYSPLAAVANRWADALGSPDRFPDHLQVACFLSHPGLDYTGGEFLLVEQRPRAQSVGHSILAEQGELIFFTTRTRPVRGARGTYPVNVRHGVSRVHSGSRYTLGVIFHDAL